MNYYYSFWYRSDISYISTHLLGNNYTYSMFVSIVIATQVEDRVIFYFALSCAWPSHLIDANTAVAVLLVQQFVSEDNVLPLFCFNFHDKWIQSMGFHFLFVVESIKNFPGALGVNGLTSLELKSWCTPSWFNIVTRKNEKQMGIYCISCIL